MNLLNFLSHVPKSGSDAYLGMGFLHFFSLAPKSGALLREEERVDEKDTFIPSHRLLRPLQSSRRKQLEFCLLIVGGTILVLGLGIAVLVGNRFTGVPMPFEPGWVTKIGNRRLITTRFR